MVRLGAGRFAVGLSHVAEVARVPPVTRVPGVPAWLAGVSNWRGRIVPALDLRTVLGAAQQPLTDRARLIVLTSEHSNVALLVEDIDGITAVGGDVAPMPDALTADAGLVSGQIPRADGPVAVLDVGAVVRLRDALPRAARGA